LSDTQKPQNICIDHRGGGSLYIESSSSFSSLRLVYYKNNALK